MSKTDDLREALRVRTLTQDYLVIAANFGDFACIDNNLYAVVRAQTGIGVDKHTRKVIYKESETLVRLIMPDPWPDA